MTTTLVSTSKSTTAASSLFEGIKQYISSKQGAGWDVMKSWSDATITTKITRWGNKSLSGAKRSADLDAKLIEANDPRVWVGIERNESPVVETKVAPKPKVKAKRSVTTEEAPKIKDKPKAKAKRSIG